MAAPRDREEAHASQILVGFAVLLAGAAQAQVVYQSTSTPAFVLNTGRAEVLGAVRLTATNTGPTAASTVQFLFQNIGCDNDQTNGVALATLGVFTGQAAIASVVNTGAGCSISIAISGALSPAVGDFIQLQGVRGRVDLSPAGAPLSGVDINTTLGATPSGSSFFTAPTVVRVATSAAGLSVSVQTGAQLSCLAPPPHPLPRVRITEALNGAFVHHVTSLAGTAPPGDARIAAGAVNNTQIRIVVADVPTGVTLNWPAVVAGTSAGSLERRTAESATTQVYEFVTTSQGTSDINAEQFDIVPTVTLGGTVAAGGHSHCSGATLPRSDRGGRHFRDDGSLWGGYSRSQAALQPPAHRSSFAAHHQLMSGRNATATTAPRLILRAHCLARFAHSARRVVRHLRGFHQRDGRLQRASYSVV